MLHALPYAVEHENLGCQEQGLLRGMADFIRGKRFGQVVDSPHAGRFNSSLDTGVAGDHDDLGLWIVVPDGLEQLKSLDARNLKIQQNQLV